MSSLAERLRGIVRPGAGRSDGQVFRRPDEANPQVDAAADADEAASVSPTLRDSAAEVLGGNWHEVKGHRYLLVERKYTPGHRHGRIALADSLPPPDGMWPRLPLLAGSPCSGRMLFVDLETTGLAGGAGSYAFLVGCGWFDAGVFRVRQFFLSSFAAERVLLEAVGELAASAGTVVTYNGKSFDLPLIESRFMLHRMSTPFAGMPHVDMLHPARRLWRSDDEQVMEDGSAGGAARGLRGRLARPEGNEGSCRLSALEETLCGYVREGDVPGFLIPSRYFQYVRSGNASPIEAVLEHNRLDLLSLALITARAAQLLEDGVSGTVTAREALGLGRLYERGGMAADARACFARAAAIDADAEDCAADRGAGSVPPHRSSTPVESSVRAEALRAYALLSRRERRYDAAAAAWRRILDLQHCPSHIVREATDALAVHHEHRVRDLRAARGFALRSMTIGGSPTRAEAVQHRLARLERKLSVPPRDSAPLFS